MEHVPLNVIIQTVFSVSAEPWYDCVHCNWEHVLLLRSSTRRDGDSFVWLTFPAACNIIDSSKFSSWITKWAIFIR